MNELDLSFNVRQQTYSKTYACVTYMVPPVRLLRMDERLHAVSMCNYVPLAAAIWNVFRLMSNARRVIAIYLYTAHSWWARTFFVAGKKKFDFYAQCRKYVTARSWKKSTLYIFSSPLRNLPSGKQSAPSTNMSHIKGKQRKEYIYALHTHISSPLFLYKKERIERAGV